MYYSDSITKGICLYGNFGGYMKCLHFFNKSFHWIITTISLCFFYACVTTPQGELTVQELIRQGRIEEAKSFFISKADVNGIDESGNTALHEAALRDDADLCTFLVFKGASCDTKNEKGDTPLHCAVKNDCVNSAKALAALGAQIFIKDADGKTALEIGLQADPAFYDALITTKSSEVRDVNGQSIVHYFVLTKDEKAIDICIQKQIPLSVKDDNGITPLALSFTDCNDVRNIRIAAKLILADAEPVRGDFSFFEDAVRTHNLSMRFDDGQTPLHIACIQGYNGMVEYLISNGAQATLQDISGATPLHEAVRYGNVECAKMLLDKGAKVNAKDSLGKTPILLIIKSDRASEMYELLIASGADCTAKDMFGDTALHVATMSAVNVAVLESLCSHNADVNARNKEGFTPLAIACDLGLIEHIKFYSNRHADIHAKDMSDNSPLTRALSQENDEILKALVNKDNVATKDSAGNTPLHIALLNHASTEGITYIIGLGTDINTRNSAGDSPLFIAVQNNNQEAGLLLIEHNADIFAVNTANCSPLRLALTRGGEVQDWMINSRTIGATDGSGNTPLHYAAEWELGNAVQALIAKGAVIDTRNSNGETPLFFACRGTDTSIINALLDSGANVNARDYLGNAPIHTAVQWDRNNTVKMLIKNNADIDMQNFSGKSPLNDAVRGGKTEIALTLLEAGADINSCDITGKSIMADSAIANKSQSVKFLLSHGANPMTKDIYGRTSFHEAVENANIEMVKILQNAGCNPLSRDTHGKTPFAIAATKNNDELLSSTLGNNVNIVDSDGNTPVHLCVIENFAPNVLEFLVNHGYPIDARNGNGKAALSIALENDKDALAAVLLQAKADPFVCDNKDICAIEIAIKKGKNDTVKQMVTSGGKQSDVQGNSFLHIAAKCATKEQITMLQGLGQDKNARNVTGETPADVAIRWKRPDIADMLK